MPKLVSGSRPPVSNYYYPSKMEPDENDNAVYERLYSRKISGNRGGPTMAEIISKQKAEDEMKECTFKPKINANVQVPAER